MKIHENFNSLHKEEEKIRQEHIAIIEQSEELSKHFSAIHDSMDIISHIINNHRNEASDELVIMRLGIRIFNSISSSIKLHLSGYHQTAFTHIRDIIETGFLLDYLITNPDKINIWESLDEKGRKTTFSPVKIRIALDERDGYSEKKRGKLYGLLCNYSTHPTPEGFKLFSPNGLSNIGPFLSKQINEAWMQELIKHTNYACIVFVKFFNKSNLLQAKESYLERIQLWANEFLIENQNN